MTYPFRLIPIKAQFTAVAEAKTLAQVPHKHTLKIPSVPGSSVYDRDELVQQI